MIEKEPVAGTTWVNDIPSDTPSPWKINLLYKEDVFLQFEDPTAETGIYFPEMRFRSSGSGPFFLLVEELAVLPEAFMNYQGQIPPGYKNRSITADLPSTFFGVKVQVGQKPDESKYIIKGIPDGNANPDDNNKFIDIEIAWNGNATVTMRDICHEDSASVEFRTAENGGKYPVLAAVFTHIAERIAKAKTK